MASVPKYYVSPREYLAIERKAEFKSEYMDGVVYALAGASKRHNLIVANIIITLGGQLKGRPCRVYPSDLKVRTPNSKRFFYPDVSVVCGDEEFADEEQDVILNPTLIVEVSSESTAAFDRGKKSLPADWFIAGVSAGSARRNPCRRICETRQRYVALHQDHGPGGKPHCAVH